jgi:hypothetical protein
MFHVLMQVSVEGTIQLKYVCYLWQPKMNIGSVGTMQAGLLPRIMAYAGEITVENLERKE